jgi:uncharacterized protein YprB with RNaseH-like and TPR domain
MTVTLEKLRALRRQAGETTSGNRAGEGGIPQALFAAPVAGAPRPDPGAQLDALRRMLGVRQRHSPAPLASRDRSIPGIEIEPGLFLAESTRPMQAPPSVPLAFAKREDSVDTDALLFFDTETTGLAGGTGTRAFMIGAADWCAGTLRIRQLTITTLAAEPAMLRTFAQWLSPRTVLCSYNGRCYDAPLLKTRFRLARMGDPISPLDHVDLLFPTRRRYRGVWENCRLATIEREALRIVREDDLPGSEAPAAWLSFLRGGSSHNLRRVAEHNLQDVVTLGRLFVHLAEAA